jgi:hypothetical protein
MILIKGEIDSFTLENRILSIMAQIKNLITSLIGLGPELD